MSLNTKINTLEQMLNLTPMLIDSNLWSDDNYNRVSLFKNSNIEIVAIYWQKGQKTNIHDHGQSKCCFAVIEGELTEQVFSGSESYKLVSEETITPKSGLCSEKEKHSISCASERAISIHIYTPPINSIPEVPI